MKIIQDIKKYIFATKEYRYVSQSEHFNYPIDLDFTLDNEDLFYSPKDCEGIPQKKYKSVGTTYNPTRVAAYGLSHWNRFISTKQQYNMEEFKKTLNWFELNHKQGRWEYDFDWDGLTAPWISCMSQGEAISILTRGYILTKDEKYLRLGIKALEPFMKEIQEGGVMSYIELDHKFYEEYPVDNPLHVLNGFLYSLIGLLELRTILKQIGVINDDLEELILSGVSTLENHIQRWDLGFWSAYDLHNEGSGVRNACTISYHCLHISQLRYIVEMSGSKKVEVYIDKWEGYVNSIWKRLSALAVKSVYRAIHRAQR